MIIPKNTTVRLDPETFKWLTYNAESRDITVTSLVEEIVTEYRAGYSDRAAPAVEQTVEEPEEATDAV